MTVEDIERVYRISAEKIAQTSLSLKRYSFDGIDWTSRLIGARDFRR